MSSPKRKEILNIVAKIAIGVFSKKKNENNFEKLEKKKLLSSL